MKTIIDKLSQLSGKQILWCFFLLCMITTCCITIAIIFANWNSWVLKIDNTSTLLMSVIAVFATFTGISVYSIFLTNINAEKEKLKELHNKFIEETKQWDYCKLLIMYYHKCQLVINTESFNGQIYDWITSINGCINDLKLHLDKLRERGQEKQFTEAKYDFLDLSRGIYYHLDSFLHRILAPNSKFFNNINEEERDNIQSKIEHVMQRLRELEVSDDLEFHKV